MAKVTQTTVQVIDSLKLTMCDFLWNTPKSSASMHKTKTLNPTQSQTLLATTVANIGSMAAIVIK